MLRADASPSGSLRADKETCPSPHALVQPWAGPVLRLLPGDRVMAGSSCVTLRGENVTSASSRGSTPEKCHLPGDCDGAASATAVCQPLLTPSHSGGRGFLETTDLKSEEVKPEVAKPGTLFGTKTLFCSPPTPFCISSHQTGKIGGRF